MKPYHEVRHEEQVRRMRRLAEAALRQYDIQPERVTFGHHGENTSFRIRGSGGPQDRYLLRIHIEHPEYRGEPPVRSELQWLQALRREAGIYVPEPILTRDGSLVARSSAEGVPGERSCVLFRWAEGRFFRGKRWPRPQTFALAGEFLGRMHNHSESYVLPEGFTRNRFDGVESYYGIPFETILKQLETDLPPEDLAVIRGVLEEGQAVRAALGEGREVFGLIHADMHWGNCFSHKGEFRAIDFDDCGFGYYLYDVALTLNSGIEQPNYPELRDAFLAAYRKVRPLPDELLVHLKTLMLLRSLNLFMWSAANLSNNTHMHEPPAEEARDVIRHLKAFTQKLESGQLKI